MAFQVHPIQELNIVKASESHADTDLPISGHIIKSEESECVIMKKSIIGGKHIDPSKQLPIKSLELLKRNNSYLHGNTKEESKHKGLNQKQTK
jgi:hypothetical protein